MKENTNMKKKNLERKKPAEKIEFFLTDKKKKYLKNKQSKTIKEQIKKQTSYQTKIT